MISASENLQRVLYETSSINIGTACTIEYNMNNLLDNIVVTYASSLESQYATTPDGRINVFKKLFPIDSIVKPFRPTNSGVKYYIMLQQDFEANPPADYKILGYPKDTKPRMYYPATTNYYKYWVTPENGEVDLTVKYIQSSATIASAYSSGPDADSYPNRAIFTTTAPHGFRAGQQVVISGGTSTALRFGGAQQTIATIVSPTQFMIETNIATTTSTGGTATLSSATKPALANKISVRFEKYHKVPTTCSLEITYSDNTVATGTTGISVPSSGNLNLYWNGTTWSTSMPYTTSQPISWPAPKEIKSIRLYGTGSAGTGRIFGIIEVSARWVKNISQDVVSFDIKKESTATPDSLLPVGTITANNLNLNIARFDETLTYSGGNLQTRKIKILPYNRDDNWKAEPNDLIYLYKDVEITPYFTIYHSNGAVTDGSLKYDRIPQGVYYLDTFDISTYGEASITSLDGAKYLMQTIPINLYLEDFSATSIIMTLLDTIGFTNYNFNLLSSDTSVPSMSKWWTNNEKTTWEHLQDLCRDIQMNAYFDENNILQFSSRDYMYSKSSADWSFYESATSVGGRTRLPSIIDFSKQEIASANQVKIIWRTPLASLYESDGTAEGLWSSETTYITAGALENTINATDLPERINFKLDFSTINGQQDIFSSFNFNGYFLVNSEIFEYDAIEYRYQQEGSSSFEVDWVESRSQWASVRSGTKVGPEYFKPTGRFRIKNRGVFGTPKGTHISASASSNNVWYKNDSEWN